MRRGHLRSERPGLLWPAVGSERERWRSGDAGDGGREGVSEGSVLFFLPPSVYISCPLWTGEEVWRKSSEYLSVVLTLQILRNIFYFFVFLIFCDRLLTLTLLIFSTIHIGNVQNNVPAALLHTTQVQKKYTVFSEKQKPLASENQEYSAHLLYFLYLSCCMLKKMWNIVIDLCAILAFDNP